MTTEREQFAADLRRMADLIVAYPEIPMESNAWSKLTANISLYMYGGDHEATKRTLATLARRIKRHVKVEKKYSGGSFTLEMRPRPDSRVRLTINAERDAVCERKVVGTEYVPPSEGYTKEIVEWDCKDPLLAPEK